MISHKQHSEVALSYLSGVPASYLWQKYREVPRRVQDLLQSEELKNDPTIEKFMNRRQEENLADIWTRTEKEDTALSRAQLNVWYSLISPSITKILKNKDFGTYDKPTNPYELFSRVVPSDTWEPTCRSELASEQIAEITLTAQMYRAIRLNEWPSLDEMVVNADSIIGEKIAERGLEWTDKKKHKVDDALDDALVAQHRRIINNYFGFGRYEKIGSIRELTKKYGYKSPYMDHTVRNLVTWRGQSNEATEMILSVAGLVSDSDIEKVRYLGHGPRIGEEYAPISIQEIELAAQRREEEENSQKQWEALYGRRVDDLDLSIRTYNCLKNANIGTVGELALRTESDLLRTKNFGRKSLNEIREFLEDVGLSLGMRFDEFGNLRPTDALD